MCTSETGAYSTLPGSSMGVEVVLKFLKFGTKASMQFVTSSEDAQNVISLEFASNAKLMNQILALGQLFKILRDFADQL